MGKGGSISDEFVLRIDQYRRVLLVFGDHLLESVRRRSLQSVAVQFVGSCVRYLLGGGCEMRRICGRSGVDPLLEIGVSTLAIDRLQRESYGERIDDEEEHDHGSEHIYVADVSNLGSWGSGITIGTVLGVL